MVIQRLYDQYMQSWYGCVNQSAKLSTYKILKTQFRFEKYLSCIYIEKHRVALFRLRCCAHKLMIEEGRYRNTDWNLRICQFCHMNSVETEYHFLLVCPAYCEIRNSCLPAYYCRWPTIHKFVQIMTNYQNGLVQRLAKYVYLAFKHRNSFLNWLSCIGIFYSISPLCLLQISLCCGCMSHCCSILILYVVFMVTMLFLYLFVLGFISYSPQS